ncbi:MAG TPA: sigma-70 family RNA polymerase sigma factor [Gemmataceae bacterium]|nr:sigma-70 family RNA polymerase sigma factor [Gemmataceae bacterium]
MAKRSYDDRDAKRLLTGSAADIADGVALIDRDLGPPFFAWLRRRFPLLAAEDLASVWQDTLLSVFKAARGRRYDRKRPLVPWLCSIANARGVDEVRREASRQADVAAVAHALRQAETGWQWERLSGPEREEIALAIGDATDTLPQRQRLVFRVWVRFYPETENLKVLRREVSRVNGKEATAASIKRALQEARRKVRTFLRATGYGPGPV